VKFGVVPHSNKMDIKKRATPVNFHALGYTISPCTSRKIAHFRLKGLFNLSMKRVLRQSVSTSLVMCRESMCALYANLMTD
jgi:hypothetical protein